MTRIVQLLTLIVLGTPLLLAHDLETRIEMAGPTVIVQISYAGEDAAAYSQVVVYSPAGHETEHQKGRADANGVFSFVPDQPGEWLFVVDDELGHRREVPINIDAAMLSSGQSQVVSGTPTSQKLLTGASFLVGATGLLFWWKARQSLRQRLPS